MHPTNLPGCSRWCARPRRAGSPRCRRLLDRLDRVDLLVKTIQTAPGAQPDHEPPGDGPARRGGGQGVAGAIAALQGKQLAAVQQLRVTSSRIDPVLIWQARLAGARAEAEKIVSLGDLIDGEHGSGFVASQAAAVFENIAHRRLPARGLLRVLPSVRLDWAERLSQFDATPRLRNLAGLPRWGEARLRTGASCGPMRTGCSGR